MHRKVFEKLRHCKDDVSFYKTTRTSFRFHLATFLLFVLFRCWKVDSSTANHKILNLVNHMQATIRIPLGWLNGTGSPIFDWNDVANVYIVHICPILWKITDVLTKIFRCVYNIICFVSCMMMSALQINIFANTIYKWW